MLLEASPCSTAGKHSLAGEKQVERRSLCPCLWVISGAQWLSCSSIVEVRGCGLRPGGTRIGLSTTNFTNSKVKGNVSPGSG